jgi:hypothetical protein
MTKRLKRINIRNPYFSGNRIKSNKKEKGPEHKLQMDRKITNIL